MTTAVAPRARATTSAAPSVATDHTALRAIPLEALQPHPANRKRFDSHQLDELAESLRAHGQLTPALVRPFGPGLGPDGATHQLLAGERRWRAAKAAGLPTLLCLVRELTDAQALEILAIENNQREDVHPLEEAELYKALLTVDGYTPATIAAKLHRSPTYVRERLRLLRLIPQAQGLVYEGRIPIAHAALLAGLSPADQKRAIGTTKHPNRYDFRGAGLFRTEETLFEDGHQLVAVSLAEFRDWIRREVRFDPKAEVAPELFPETVAAVEAAEAARAKVLHLTTDHIVHDGARDGKVRTIGAPHWKRADGFKGSRKCPHAELGVVVSGAGQGQAFPVCIKKDQCDVHWKQERKERERRAKAGQVGGSRKGQPRAQTWQEAEEERKIVRKRLAAERRAVLEAIEAKGLPTVEALAPYILAQLVELADLDSHDLLDEKVGKLPRNRGIAKCVAAIAAWRPSQVDKALFYALVGGDVTPWDDSEPPFLFALARHVGVDPKKVVLGHRAAANGAAAPKPAKKLAGDVRRARKKARG